MEAAIDSRSLWSMMPPKIRVATVIALVATVIAIAGGYWSRYRDTPADPAASAGPGMPPPDVLPLQFLDLPPADARAINEQQPFVTAPTAAARPLVFDGPPAARARAIDCLAAAVLYEAGDEALGERAVAQVVINRARHPAFPATICGVVFQGSDRRTGCQFTFTCDGALATRTPSPAAWERARAIAASALEGAVMARVGYATHYHADYVVPNWRSSLDKITAVGPHLFYRWQGYWGTPAAFRRNLSNEEPIEPMLARLSPAHVDPAGPQATAALDTAATRDPNAPPAMSVVLSDQAGADLRGSEPRLAADGGRTVFLKLDASAFPGSYASAALGICRGKPACQVLGWRDSRQVAAGLPLTPNAGASLSFLYVRKNGGEAVLWNCRQTPRPSPSQCLPGDAGAIRRLMLDD